MGDTVWDAFDIFQDTCTKFCKTLKCSADNAKDNVDDLRVQHPSSV